MAKQGLTLDQRMQKIDESIEKEKEIIATAQSHLKELDKERRAILREQKELFADKMLSAAEAAGCENITFDEMVELFQNMMNSKSSLVPKSENEA